MRRGGTSSAVRGPLAALRRPVGAALVAILLLVLATTIAVRQPPARTGSALAAPTRIPLGEARLVCPEPAGGTGMEGVVGASSAGALGTGSEAPPGSLRLTELADPAAADVLEATDVRGAGASVTLDRAVPPLVVTAEGGLAPGLSGVQLTRGTAVDQRGWAAAGCLTPSTDAWFVGSGAEVGRRGQIVLANAEKVPAVVDVTLWGPDGPLPAPGGRGLVVAGGAQETVALDALAPGTERFGIHVQTREGRVAAAVRDSHVEGLDARGWDWVAPAVPPADSLVLPGVAPGPGPRSLQVLVPGDADAIVRLRLATGDGTFAPADIDVLEVAAGSVTEVSLDGALSGAAAAVLLDSDVPITAALLSRHALPGPSTGPVQDLAWTAASAPIGDAAVVVAPRLDPAAVRQQLLLTASGREATVRLTAVTGAGEAGSGELLTVPAGTTVSVDLDAAAPPRTAALLVERIDGGAVHGARIITEDAADAPLVAVEPLRPAVRSVLLPAVTADLTVGRSSSRSRS